MEVVVNDAILFLNECIESGCDVALVGNDATGQLDAVRAACRLAGVGCVGHTACDLSEEVTRLGLVDLVESGVVEPLVLHGGVLFIDNTADMDGRTVQPLPDEVEACLRRLAGSPGRSPRFSIVLNTTGPALEKTSLEWLSGVSWQ